MNPILETALEWLDRGCSVIPLSRRAKHPAVKWKRYQTERPTERDLQRWFSRGQFNLAVIFGDISGGLGSMDFDDVAAYHSWASTFPDTAELLPTVETRRGRHVYFRTHINCVRELRERLGKCPDRIGALQFGYGELRLGAGCYSVLPPSTHPTGFEYRWLSEPAWPLPIVDPAMFVQDLPWPLPIAYIHGGADEN